MGAMPPTRFKNKGYCHKERDYFLPIYLSAFAIAVILAMFFLLIVT